MPAVMAALVSVVVSFMNETPYVIDDTQVPWLKQLYCLLCTLGVAIISGSGNVNAQKVKTKTPYNCFISRLQTNQTLVTGAILRIPQIEALGDYEYFEDGKYWEIEEEEEED